MRLYLDEDIASKELATRLSAAHEVVETRRGEHDRRAWDHAQAERATVVTLNARDFIALASVNPGHHGLLVAYRENNPRLDMTAGQIAAAIDRVAATYPDLTGLVVVLNQFRR